jgi:hypothetical protein
MLKRRRLKVPDAVVSQIKSYAPEHAVRMAPVFRAIRAPRQGFMPHNSLMYKRAISFMTIPGDLMDDEFVQASIEAIEVNDLFDDLSIRNNIDIRIVESAFGAGLNKLLYLSCNIPVAHQDRWCRAFEKLEDLETLDVTINDYHHQSVMNVDWDCVLSGLIRRSPELSDLTLDLEVDRSYPRTQDAILCLSRLSVLDTSHQAFDFRRSVGTLYFKEVDCSELLHKLRSGKCDNLSCLTFTYPDDVDTNELASELVNLIRRSTRLYDIELYDYDVWWDDGNVQELADVIRASHLREFKTCSSMFTDEAVGLIRAACEEAEVDFCLYDD